MKSKITGLFILIVFFLTTVSAQQPTTLTLSLKEAVDYSLKYNRTLKNSEMAVDKAGQALKEAIANGLPQVDAKVDYSNALGAKMSIRFNENMPANEIPIKPSSNLNLQVTQLIFNGSYIIGVQTARLYRDLTEINQLKSEIDVKSEVTRGYHLVLASREMYNRLQKNLLNLKDLYKKTEVLASAGIIEQTDADQLFVQLNTMQNAVNASERQLELATNMLRLQLGCDINTELVLTDNLESIVNDVDVTNTLARNFKPENNLDYRLMDQQVLISRKMLYMKKSAALPSIGGYYSYTYKLLKPEFDMAPANMVGLQVNIPIFSSGVRYHQTKQAFIDLKTIQNNRELVTDQLRIQDKQLRFNLINALETYNNQKSNIDISRRVYGSLKLKYEQGMISGLDLITADNNYIKAETDYISATLQLLDARLEFEKINLTAN